MRLYSPCGCRTPFHMTEVDNICFAWIKLGIIQAAKYFSARFLIIIEARSLTLLICYHSLTNPQSNSETISPIFLMDFTMNKQKHSRPALFPFPRLLPTDLFYLPPSKPVPKIPLSLTTTKAAATEDSCNPQPISTTTQWNPKTFKHFIWLNPRVSSLLALQNCTLLLAKRAPRWCEGKKHVGRHYITRVVWAPQSRGCSGAVGAGGWATRSSEMFPTWCVTRTKMENCQVTYPV